LGALALTVAKAEMIMLHTSDGYLWHKEMEETSTIIYGIQWNCVAFSINWCWTSLLEQELCWWFTATS